MTLADFAGICTDDLPNNPLLNVIVCFEFEWELDLGFDDLSSALQACAAGRPLGAVDGALISSG